MFESKEARFGELALVLIGAIGLLWSIWTTPNTDDAFKLFAINFILIALLAIYVFVYCEKKSREAV